MRRHVIRLGDPTTHGGQVVSASGTVTINGKRVARKGDHVMCPLPGHGAVTIIEGDPLLTDDDKPIALEGHKCSRGCSLISTLSTFVRSDEGGGAGMVGSAAGAAGETMSGSHEPGQDDEYDQHLILEDQDGNPLDGIPYRLFGAQGAVIEGVTATDGKTQLVSGDDGDTLDCEIAKEVAA